jgi:agmatinase
MSFSVSHFDSTSTYRTGARFGLNAIRQASLNIESYSFRSGLNVEDLALYDAGDLHVSSSTQKTIDVTRLVVEDILAAGKMPVALGGEHTITLGIAEALGAKAGKTAIVSFDAHLDLRCEYLESTLSHTTFMQLINEEVKPAKIFEVGTRSVCKEELAYANTADVEFSYFPGNHQTRLNACCPTAKREASTLRKPLFNHGRGCVGSRICSCRAKPEPEGITTTALLDITCALCDERVIGFDVVEVAPIYNQDVSATVAAKIILEMLCQLEKSRKP